MCSVLDMEKSIDEELKRMKSFKKKMKLSQWLSLPDPSSSLTCTRALPTTRRTPAQVSEPTC